MIDRHDGSREPAPTAGIDWASSEHAAAVVDAYGQPIERFDVPHTAAGLRQLTRRLRRAGVEEVAIERPDGPVVDALLEAELTVFVIDPKQLKNLRGRYGSAGNKDDRFDAYVLADVLRTDRARMRPLTRDSEQTITLRMTVRARQDLVHARVAMANQLRAHLETVFPGAIGLFRDIDSTISLTFLARPARTRPTGSAADDWRPGWARWATATKPTSTGSGTTCTAPRVGPGDPKRPRAPRSPSPW